MKRFLFVLLVILATVAGQATAGLRWEAELNQYDWSTARVYPDTDLVLVDRMIGTYATGSLAFDVSAACDSAATGNDWNDWATELCDHGRAILHQRAPDKTTREGIAAAWYAETGFRHHVNVGDCQIWFRHSQARDAFLTKQRTWTASEWSLFDLPKWNSAQTKDN